MSTPDRARQLRRRHMHERQAVVFGALVLVLAVAGLGATGIYTGVISASWLDRPFVTPGATSSAAAAAVYCPPTGALPVPYAQITVNVYNAAGTAGLAATTASSLAERGFVIGVTDNAGTSYDGTARIVYGVSGSAAAYTLAAQVEDALLVLDARSDASVDFAVGSGFVSLIDTASVALVADQVLQGPTGCTPLEQILTTPSASVAAETPAA